MRAAAHTDTSILSILVWVTLVGCASVTPIEPGVGSGAASANAGATPANGNAGATHTNEAGSGAHASDAGTRSHAGSSAPSSDAGRGMAMPPDASCLPLPCPSNAPWSAAKCACVANDTVPSMAGECMVDSDCSLVVKGCCGTCLPPNRDQVLAVPKSRAVDVQRAQCPNQSTCGQCYVQDPDPLAPVLKAGCVAYKCELVDLRASAISRCVENIDCKAVGLGCCPPSSDSPSEYVGLSSGADAGILECSPVPPCIDTQGAATPLLFCAQDGHCAVRRHEKLHGMFSIECYSPTQNLEHAYDAAAVGCDCAPGSLAVCRADQNGRFVALTCQDSWKAVEDGPCGI